MSTRPLSAIAVLAASAGLIASFAAFAEWTKPLPEFDNRPIRQWTPDLVPLGDPADGQSKQNSFTQTFARPIFSPTRRPFEPPKPEAPAVAEAPPEPPPPAPAIYDASQFSLRGIMISGNVRRALIASPESPDGIWVADGTEIMGWKVANVEHNNVRLEAQGQTAEIKLYVDKPAN